MGPLINPHVNSDSVQRSQLYPNVRHSAGATSVYRARTRTDHQSGGLRDSCQWQSHHKHRICLSQLLMQVRHRWAICLWIADKILLPWIVRWKSIGHIGDTTISESPITVFRDQPGHVRWNLHLLKLKCLSGDTPNIFQGSSDLSLLNMCKLVWVSFNGEMSWYILCGDQDLGWAC